MNQDILTWLERWYLSQTDDDWEHQHGIQIETTDNPGWRVAIDLVSTSLSMKAFERIEVETSDRDWFHCWVTNQQFHIACGPTSLCDALATFRTWTESL